jgi:hypothetical protein
MSMGRSTPSAVEFGRGSYQQAAAPSLEGASGQHGDRPGDSSAFTAAKPCGGSPDQRWQHLHAALERSQLRLWAQAWRN